MKAVYLHVPFCDSICAYCDFCRIITNEDTKSKWMAQIIEEIKQKNIHEVDTLYFGGGTPSSLACDQFEKIASLFNVSKEFTVECNPESLDLEKIQLYKKLGVNRISLGVQTFNDRLLKVINRIISGCKMKSTLSSLFLSFVVAILAFFIIYKWTNYDTTLLDLCYSNDINYVMLSSRRMTYYDHGGFDDSAIDFSEEQLKTIGEYCEQDYLFISQSIDFYKNSIDDEYEFMSNASALIDSIGYNTFELVLNTSSNLDLKRDPRISFDINMRLPSSDNEIALTWLQADFLMKYGLISHGNHVFLDSLDDLIGLEINHKKITGIYSTEDEDFFSKHVSFSDSHDKYSAHFNHTFALARSIISFKKIDSGANILVRLSGDKHKDTNFIKSLDKRVFGIGDYVSLSTPFDAFPLSQNIFSIESPGYGYFLGISWTVLLLISYFIKRNTMRLYTPSLFYRYRYLKSYGFSKPKAEIFVWFVMLVRIIFEFLSSLVFIGLTCFVFNRLSYYSFLSLGVLSSVLVLFILVFIEEFIYFRQYRK